MVVRDRLQDGYKGRETNAACKSCPCMPCFNAHDCGYSLDKWIAKMECAERHNSGCPREPQRPIHIFRFKVGNQKAGKSYSCARCGQLIEFNPTESNFDFMTLDAYKEINQC